MEGFLKGDGPKPAEKGDMVALRENILEIIRQEPRDSGVREFRVLGRKE